LLKTAFSATMPLVSILVPTYNRAATLRQTLDSVFSQSVQDFEIVLVDDASTDSTSELLASYSDPRLRVYRNETNLGQAGNAARCLSLATAPFVHYLYSDDFFLPDCLSRKLDAISADPDIALVFAATRIIAPDGSPVATRRPYPTDRVLDGARLARYSFRFKNAYGEPSNVLFRRELSNRLGGFAPELSYTVDWEFWIRLSCQARVAYLATPLSAFRISRGSVTGALRWRSFRSDDDAFVRRVRSSARLPLTPLDLLLHRLTQPPRMLLRDLWLRRHL
jgi:glycosyltransferase involved in cell wall biosynthesis